MTPTPSPNFAFLAHYDALLVALGTQAEEHFATDPTVTLFKWRPLLRDPELRSGGLGGSPKSDAPTVEGPPS